MQEKLIYMIMGKIENIISSFLEFPRVDSPLKLLCCALLVLILPSAECYDKFFCLKKKVVCLLLQFKKHSKFIFLNSVFSALLDFVTSGPVVAFEIVGENAVAAWNEAVGPTDPSAARKSAPTSIRAQYGTGKINVILQKCFSVCCLEFL